MKKYKIIKILFIFILASSISNKYPLLGGLFGILLIYFLNFKGVNKKLSSSKKNFKYLIYGLLIVCLLFFAKHFIGNSEYDSFLISLISARPWYYFIYVVLLSPILEELTFRYGFDAINNEYLYLIISSLLFSVIRVNSLSEYLYFIIAFIFSLVLGYVYKKSDDIKLPICFHILYNLLFYLMVVF